MEAYLTRQLKLIILEENSLSERFEPVMFGCLNSVDSHGLSFFVCQRRYCPTKHQMFGRKLKNKFSKNLKSVWG